MSSQFTSLEALKKFLDKQASDFGLEERQNPATTSRGLEEQIKKMEKKAVEGCGLLFYTMVNNGNNSSSELNEALENSLNAALQEMKKIGVEEFTKNILEGNYSIETSNKQVTVHSVAFDFTKNEILS